MIKFQPHIVLAVLVGLSVLLRWGSFFPSVINHDESTYIVIADEMLRGEVYLDESIDTKPIGLFWLYAAMVWLTGGSIIGLRFLATLAIAITAFFLAKAGKRVTGSDRVGWAAGLIYPFLCTLFTYYGISPNTELFFNAFTAAAIYFTVAGLSKEDLLMVLNYTGAGLLLGAAVTIKPVAAAEALSVGLFTLWLGWQRQKMRSAILKACLPMTLAFCVPLLVVYGYYARLDMLDELLFYNWELTKRYPVDLPWYLRLKYLGDYLLRFSPFVLAAGYAWVKAPKINREWRWFLLLQLVIVALVVLAPGKRFGHYQVQLHPIIAALAALAWHERVPRPGWLPKLNMKKTAALVGGLALALGVVFFFYYQNKRDQAREVAEWLNERLQPAEEAFMLNFHQIVYHLIDRPVPTKYVHSSLLFYDHHVEALELDLTNEARKFIDNPRLKYVVAKVEDVEELYVDNPITQAITAAFPEVTVFDDELLIFHRP